MIARQFKADKETVRKRLDQCRVCEHKKSVFCGKCGCPVGAKAQLAGATCPVGKWSFPTGVKK